MNPPATPRKRPVLKIVVGSKSVEIPITARAQADFARQFKRNTPAQEERYHTLMALMRFAYEAGGEAGSQPGDTVIPDQPDPPSDRPLGVRIIRIG